VCSWLGLERFRSSERRQARQPDVASGCEEGLTTTDPCYIDDDDDDDADALRKTDAHVMTLTMTIMMMTMLTFFYSYEETPQLSKW